MTARGAARSAGPRLLVHGGAGGRGAGDPAFAAAAHRALRAALEAGSRVLAGGGCALDAAVAAVAALEDAPELNAGRGSVLTADGRVQMDACVMDGARGRAGAVAAVEDLAHPVEAARLVLEASPHVLLAGPDAVRFARAHGATPAAPGALVTEARRRALDAARTRGEPALDHDAPGPAPRDAPPPGTGDEGGATVGAVALDGRGGLAAATSTGGMTHQLPGRVGDSPVPGAGTWADARVAISATGEGEHFLEAAFAHEVAVHVRRAGVSVEEACRAALALVAARGGRGGCIALDAQGRAAMPFTTAHMLRGAVGPDAAPRTWT